jgi:putative transposase
MPDPLGGTSPKFTKRVRKLELMDTKFQAKGCRCLMDTCSEHAAAGAFYCIGHGILQHKVPHRPVPATIYSATTLKAALLVPDAELPEEHSWYRSIPYNTRDMALRRFSQAMSSFFQVRKSNKDAEPPDFRSKKDRRQMFSVDHRAITYTDTGVIIFPSLKLGTLRVRKRGRNKVKEMRARSVPGKSQCAADVVRDEAGRWYVVQPFHVAAKEPAPIWESQSYQDVFIDPGARTFASFWSPDGVAGKLGDGLYPIIKKTLFRADRLTSETARLRNIPRGTRGRKTRCQLRRLSAKSQALRTKVRDIVRDLHHKAARFLCENFKAVHIGNMHGGEVCGLGGRTINSKAVRNLMTFALAEFHGYMASYAKARGVHFFVVGEEHTTRTCTSCGDNMDRGSVKTIDCKKCNTKVDRDIASGRNLALKIAMA